MSEQCDKHGPYSVFCRECDLETVGAQIMKEDTTQEVDIALLHALLNAVGVFRWQQGRAVPVESVMTLETIFERAEKCEPALARIETEVLNTRASTPLASGEAVEAVPERCPSCRSYDIRAQPEVFHGRSPYYCAECRASIRVVRAALTPAVDEQEVAQALQDHMEQFHGVVLKASEWDAVAIAAITASNRVGEEGPPCENCGKPVAVGQLVLCWDDAGEMHVDCENPYALVYEPGEGDPPPVILLGSPMRHVPLATLSRSGEGV